MTDIERAAQDAIEELEEMKMSIDGAINIIGDPEKIDGRTAHRAVRHLKGKGSVPPVSSGFAEARLWDIVEEENYR